MKTEGLTELTVNRLQTKNSSVDHHHHDHHHHDHHHHDHHHHDHHHHDHENKEHVPEQPRFWRSTEEWMDTPEFREMMHREFPEDADQWTDPVSRRHFLTIMGASMSLAAAAAGCSPRPASSHPIIPPVNQPVELIPGVPHYFATAITLSGVATGVLAKSYEGRPVKLEGNPSHPSSIGGTDMLTQASILNLYDPDRSKNVLKQGIPSTYEDVIADLKKALSKHKVKQGEGFYLVTGTVTSPTLHAMIKELLRDMPNAKWYQYDAINNDYALEASKIAFGKPIQTVYDFSRANVVLSLDADFINDGPGKVRYAHDYSRRRKVRSDARDGVTPKEMNRLYVVETMPSNTGSIADHRLSLSPIGIELFTRHLASELGVPGAAKPSQPLSADSQGWLKPMAEDLKANAGKSLVLTGIHQSVAVQVLVHAINDHLKNTGATVFHTQPIQAEIAPHVAGVKQLAKDMSANKVESLLIIDCNLAYTAPADLKIAEKISKVPLSIHLGSYTDETGSLCYYHVPGTHSLEIWGDARGHDGTISIIQPLIAPIFNGVSVYEMLAALLEYTEQNGRSVLRNAYKQKWEKEKRSGSFELFWETLLQSGIVPDSAFAKTTEVLIPSWSEKIAEKSTGNGSTTQIVFRPDPTLYDGCFANNGWLQEVPKPITKITWDNAAIMSISTAKKLGVPDARPSWTAGEHGRAEVVMVELTFSGHTLKMPAWILPGHADDCVTVHLGHGREYCGKVGNGIGFNTYQLRTSDTPWSGSGLSVKKTADTHLIACTQMHHSMEDRKPIRYASINEYQFDKNFASAPPVAAGEAEEIRDLLPGPKEKKYDDNRNLILPSGKHTGKEEGKESAEHDKGPHDQRLVPLTMLGPTNKVGRRWAMAIDLGSCTGCNACMIACQAENNISVVGKKEVTRGREMHWIRVDRYYEGSPENASELSTHFQPVPCQQCEKAPCEVVCPVGATVHSHDGLNDMVYNRCVGTRYCSNNCPYKVRRFNFFTFADYATESLKLLHNPEVTLRSRGVMEKCTYCVQRIRAAEIEAERERRPIADGEIVTACQAACPSKAIVFGDLSDEQSVVNRWKNEPLNYGLLAELNTMPRTTYLAAIRNPNPKMPTRKANEKSGHQSKGE